MEAPPWMGYKIEPRLTRQRAAKGDWTDVTTSFIRTGIRLYENG